MKGKAKAVDFILYVMKHAPYAHLKHWHGNYAIAYTDGPCPKLTVYKAQHMPNSTDFYRRSMFNDRADQAMVAYKLLDDAGKEQLLPELYERCNRNRRNRDIPFWSPLKGEGP